MKNETKKTNGKIRIAVVTSIAALGLAFLVQAQDTDSPRQRAGGRDSMPSMMGMMEQCQKQCDDGMKQCRDVMAKLREARDSNDAAKMRAAIDDSLKMCEQMSGNMSECMKNMTNSCMGMMRMMERMHGGMMGKGMMQQGDEK